MKRREEPLITININQESINKIEKWINQVYQVNNTKCSVCNENIIKYASISPVTEPYKYFDAFLECICIKCFHIIMFRVVCKADETTSLITNKREIIITILTPEESKIILEELQSKNNVTKK